MSLSESTKSFEEAVHKVAMEMEEERKQQEKQEKQEIKEEALVAPESKKRSRKQASPKHISELPEEAPAKKAKKADVKREEWEKYTLFAKLNEKALKKPKLKESTCLFDYQKQLQNPDVIKAYMLPAFYFLATNKIRATHVTMFDNAFIQTMDVFEKLKFLGKLSGDLALKPELLDTFEKKYGKKFWKIPKRDYTRVKSLIASQGYADAILTGIEEELIVDNNDNKQSILCLNPIIRWE